MYLRKVVFLNILIFILYVISVLPARYLCEGVGSPGTGITDRWELNLGQLKERPVLLATDPSPQP